MFWKILKAGGFCCSLLLTGPAAAQPFFTEVTDQAFEGKPFIARSTAFGDYDNDGWPDLFLAEDRTSPARVALYHNEGHGQFTYQAAAIPDELTSKWKGGSIFGDYDNDGDLDLLVSVGAYASDYADRNILLRNDRGVFRDVALEAGLTDSLPTDNAIWLDYDRDGHLDLYTGNLGCGDAAGHRAGHDGRKSDRWCGCWAAFAPRLAPMPGARPRHRILPGRFLDATPFGFGESALPCPQRYDCSLGQCRWADHASRPDPGAVQ